MNKPNNDDARPSVHRIVSPDSNSKCEQQINRPNIGLSFWRKRAKSIESDVLEYFRGLEPILQRLAQKKGCKISDAWILKMTQSDCLHDQNFSQSANNLHCPDAIVELGSGDLPYEESQTINYHEYYDPDFVRCLQEILDHLNPQLCQIHDAPQDLEWGGFLPSCPIHTSEKSAKEHLRRGILKTKNETEDSVQQMEAQRHQEVANVQCQCRMDDYWGH